MIDKEESENQSMSFLYHNVWSESEVRFTDTEFVRDGKDDTVGGGHQAQQG